MFVCLYAYMCVRIYVRTYAGMLLHIYLCLGMSTLSLRTLGVHIMQATHACVTTVT